MLPREIENALLDWSNLEDYKLFIRVDPVSVHLSDLEKTLNEETPLFEWKNAIFSALAIALAQKALEIEWSIGPDFDKEANFVVSIHDIERRSLYVQHKANEEWEALLFAYVEFLKTWRSLKKAEIIQ